MLHAILSNYGSLRIYNAKHRIGTSKVYAYRVFLLFLHIGLDFILSFRIFRNISKSGAKVRKVYEESCFYG